MIQRTTLVVAAAWVWTAATAGPAAGALTIADVQFWTGAPDGPDVNRAVLVVDWAHGLTLTGAPASLAWGYRWPAGQTRTGQDMLAAIAGADARLSVDGVAVNFPGSFGYDETLDGMAELFFPGYDPVTSEYWQYFVNNAVIDGTPANNYLDAAHVLPPNGNPYDGAGPGSWVLSSTGIVARPLVDGSWDGFIYARDSPGPGAPQAAPIPEPQRLVLAGAAIILAGRRRRSRTQP